MATRSAPRTTIHDVAAAAGVSRQTVSNAINNPHRVRPSTLQRVLHEIERLGYRPSSAAQVMRSDRAGAIGVELNAVDQHVSEVAQHVLVELTAQAPRHDVHLVPFAHRTTFPAVDGYQDMVRRALVDAFIFADTHNDDPRPQWLSSRGIPFAAFGRIYGHPEMGAWVDVDGLQGTTQAVEHVVAQGYRTVAYLGWPLDQQHPEVADDRHQGWQRTSRQLRVQGPEAACAQDLAAAVRAGEGLLDQLGPGDAVVCASDLLALGVGYAAAGRGLHVGTELGLVGFDGSVLATRHGLTTVVQPFEAIAETLLRLVHDQLADGAPAPVSQLLTPSLAPGPSTDRDPAAAGFIPHPADRRRSRRRAEGSP